MFGSKRVLWATGAFIAALFLAPAIAMCVEEDPYIYRSLIGRVYFEYQKNDATSKGGSTSESSRFLQTYSLDVRGNFMSRRLVIYDAGLSYTLTDYKSSASTTNTDSISYFLRTTLLPKSAIPLTLYGSQTETTNTRPSAVDTSKTTNYGLTWNARVRPLPIMSLNLDTAKSESNNSETQTDSMRFEAKKDVGPTDNHLFYTSRSSSASTRAGDSSAYTLNFINDTKISKSTSFNFTTTRSVNEPADSTPTTSQGYAVFLRSSPNIDFTQNHTYSYFQTRGEGRQQGSNYSGDMSYQFSKDLGTSLSLTTNSTDNELATTKQETKSLTSSGNVSYKVTKNLMFAEALSYTNFQTNSADQTSSNTSDFTSFSAMTNVSYFKPLSWAFLSTSYGLGYVREKSTAGKGTGISQNASLSLSGIDLRKIATVSTSFSYADTEATSGDIKVEQRSFSANASNTLGRKYVTVSAGYNKAMTSSWVQGLDAKNESYRLDMGTGFKKVNVRAFFENIKTFNEMSGWSSVINEGLSLMHRNQIFGGTLEFLADITQTERDYVGGTDKFLTKHANAKYSRVLRRPIFWSAEADWFESKEDVSLTRTTYIRNVLTYPLRAWLFAFEHRYTRRETNIQETTENLYLFKAMRTFVRFF